jgi:hypothetical protein
MSFIVGIIVCYANICLINNKPMIILSAYYSSGISRRAIYTAES